MAIQIDFAQLGTNLLVAVGSAWFGAWFGAHQAFETAKRGKAFDQRLEWYLRTIRAMKQFQLGMEQYLSVAKTNREAAIPIAARVEPMMMEFLMCSNEATLFTDRTSIVCLRDGAKKFCDMLRDARGAMDRGEGWNTIVQMTASLNKLVESIEFDLTRRHREQLGLDVIKPEDLGA